MLANNDGWKKKKKKKLIVEDMDTFHPILYRVWDVVKRIKMSYSSILFDHAFIEKYSRGHG